MKKAFPANINGTVFYIDEDAFELLSTYLTQLRTAFPGQEGLEIITDIEARIAELFNELMDNGSRVITITDVNAVIEQMGRPADLSGATGFADEAPADEDTHCDTATPPPFSADPPTRKRLYRDERNKVFGGVLSGLAIYLGWNVTVMRVLYAVLCVCSYFWPMLIIYLIAWMIIPPARTPRQILEMTGTPVTINNVGQTILGTADPNAPAPAGNTAQTVFSVLGKAILAFLGILGVGLAVGGLVLLIFSISGWIVFSGWGNIEILDALDLFDATVHPVMGAVGTLCFAMALIIPAIALIWAACVALFKSKGASTAFIVTAVVLEVFFIVGALVFINIASIGPVHEYHIDWEPGLITAPLSLLPVQLP